ncbi:hypothetical protein OG921_03185 [Aldersonia sp. NBC_00410]|uniref:hypothetical protein n=1 Tax=Aldersonia sp. NBC_00410 TaxID=2975954 RepID=UPI0022531354|nr:hypothetical protein [Aldersonia sp. NBC_00410]MCX5042195.1 hypothetical protein [Aldersonia sp. NBC_00410]
MKLRQFVVRALGVGAVGAAAMTVAAVPAAAAPAPVQGWWMYGSAIPAIGENAFCTGIVDLGVETDPAVPGHATVTFTSRGMRGAGEEWARNPSCPITFQVSSLSGTAPYSHTRFVKLVAGEAPGALVREDIEVGSGLAGLSTIALNSLSAPSTVYFIAP